MCAFDQVQIKLNHLVKNIKSPSAGMRLGDFVFCDAHAKELSMGRWVTYPDGSQWLIFFTNLRRYKQEFECPVCPSIGVRD